MSTVRNNKANEHNRTAQKLRQFPLPLNSLRNGTSQHLGEGGVPPGEAPPCAKLGLTDLPGELESTWLGRREEEVL